MGGLGWLAGYATVGGKERVTVGGEVGQVEVVATDLEIPWGAAFHGNTLYLTERTGRIVRISGVVDGGTDLQHEVVVDLTDETAAKSTDYGGLLGLVFHPTDPDIAYTYHTHRHNGTLYDRILRHDVANGFQHETIFDGIIASNVHDGGRLVIHDEALYATTGDSHNRPQLAQDPTKLAGNVLRLTLDGQPHPKNPFGNAVFTYGHRNPQGLVFRQGRLYSTEHGPDRGDEINILEAGKNYGWPVVTGKEDRERFTPPIAAYTPPVAPASATFYDGPIAAWQGDFFFGTLIAEHLRRARVRGRKVHEQERLLEGDFGRLRTAFNGPDDHLYVTTSNHDAYGSPVAADDRLLRIRP